ncbi:MAG: S9 family peptidase, partial [Saprospiraceae bacterium]
MKSRLSFFVLMLMIIPELTSQVQKRNLQPDDIYRMQNIGDAQISPEGNWIAFTISTIDSAKDKRNTDLWMTSWDGATSIQLTNSPESENNPKWSPDGKFISFTASRSGGSNQIYLLNRLGGEAIKLTDVKGDLSDYSWSPDSKKILLAIKEPADTSKKMGKPWVINKYQFKQDVSGYQYDQRKTHLYIFDTENKKTDTITRGEYNESNAQWSPDGSKIAFASNHTEDPDKNRNSDIFIIDAKPGSEAKALTTWAGSDQSPQWSPDGKSIAYLRSTSDENYFMYDQSVLCVIPVSGGTPTLLSKSLDRPVNAHRWNKDGRSIVAIVSSDA